MSVIEKVIEKIPFDERLYKYIVVYLFGLINFFGIGYLVHGVMFGFKELNTPQILIAFLLSSVITLIGIIYFYSFLNLKNLAFTYFNVNTIDLGDRGFEIAYLLATIANLWMGTNFFEYYFNPTNQIFHAGIFASYQFIKTQYCVGFVFISVLFTFCDLLDVKNPE